MAYHHGSLKEDLLAAAARRIAERGPDGVSLRELARELGVSHTAPRHHFGDKRGVITAVAAQGFRLLAGRLAASGGDFLESGVAYVRFALDHPGHFAVMFRPELVNDDDAELREARSRTRSALLAGAGAHAKETGRDFSPASGDAELPAYALLAWSAAHGMADLALSGALTAMGMGGSVEAITARARASLQQLRPA